MNAVKKFLDWLERQQSFPDLSALSKLKKIQMLKSMTFSTFDIDGVIFISKEIGGVHPGPDDVIVTGRSYEESLETLKMLEKRGIHNPVFFNPLPFAEKTRESSGEHKARVISGLIENGCVVRAHYEDDPVQARVVGEKTGVPVIMIGSNDFTELENIRRTEF